MTTDQIIQIVEQVFSEEISSSAFESALGLESTIDGKEEFLRVLRERIVQENNKMTLAVKALEEIGKVHSESFSAQKARTALKEINQLRS